MKKLTEIAKEGIKEAAERQKLDQEVKAHLQGFHQQLEALKTRMRKDGYKI